MILAYLVIVSILNLDCLDFIGSLINILVFFMITVFAQLRNAKKKTSLDYLQLIFYPEIIEAEGDKYDIDHLNKTAKLICKGNEHNFIRSSIMFDDRVFKVESLGKKCLKNYHFKTLTLQTDYRTNKQCYSIRRVKIDYLPQNADSFNFLFHLTIIESVELTEKCRNMVKNEGIIYSLKDTKLFYCPKNRHRLTIRESCTSICSNAFISCGNIRFIYFPSSVQRIGDRAFKDCVRLKRVRFHKQSHLVSIGAEAFSYTALKAISFPRSLQSIGSSAFYPCYFLRRVVFPKDSNLMSCEKSAFSRIRNLEIVAPKHFLLFPSILMKQ